jgi:hypothetical protein
VSCAGEAIADCTGIGSAATWPLCSGSRRSLPRSLAERWTSSSTPAEQTTSSPTTRWSKCSVAGRAERRARRAPLGPGPARRARVKNRPARYAGVDRDLLDLHVRLRASSEGGRGSGIELPKSEAISRVTLDALRMHGETEVACGGTQGPVVGDDAGRLGGERQRQVQGICGAQRDVA